MAALVRLGDAEQKDALADGDVGVGRIFRRAFGGSFASK